MIQLISWLNSQHWYVFAIIFIAFLFFWTYGCVSTTESLIHEGKKVNRSELQNELTYLIGLAKSRDEDLDRQDAGKQALLDSANVISQTGSINPSGLLNIAATIGAISFGLNRQQKIKELRKKSP